MAFLLIIEIQSKDNRLGNVAICASQLKDELINLTATYQIS